MISLYLVPGLRRRIEYILNTRAVLQRLQDFNILLKLSKCKFGLTAVTYLGHLVERHGIRIEEKRKEEIENMTLPDTVTKLRSFLGMTNFFSDFIHDYAAMSSVLFALLHGAKSKQQAIQWTEDAQRSFNNLKKAIVDAPMLRFLKRTGKITLYTDASTYGCGGMLTQIQEDDSGNAKEYPIMFISKVFSAVQKRWATCEQEMFGVYLLFDLITGIFSSGHMSVRLQKLSDGS